MCVYKSYMTEQKKKHAHESVALGSFHHLGLTEPITTKYFIWLKAFKHATCSSVKVTKIDR